MLNMLCNSRDIIIDSIASVLMKLISFYEFIRTFIYFAIFGMNST